MINIRRVIVIVALMLAMLLILVSCGEVAPEVGEYAIVSLPNGEIIEGEVESITRWTYAYTEVTINGITYGVHPLCIAVIIGGEN
jgi:hypothetical protein